MTAAKIAAQLRREIKGWGKNGSPAATHIATQLERTLCAVIELEKYRDPVSDAYTAGAAIERRRVRSAIEKAWNQKCPPPDILREHPVPKRSKRKVGT